MFSVHFVKISTDLRQFLGIDLHFFHDDLLICLHSLELKDEFLEVKSFSQLFLFLVELLNFLIEFGTP